MSFQTLGDLEQMDTMQAQGVADYEFENVLERYASQVWAGSGGGQMADSGQNPTQDLMFENIEAGFGRWVENMTGTTTDINEQFYNQIGSLSISDSGYLEASADALAAMTSNIEEASKLLGLKQKPIRTIGDLHEVYRKDKKKRERAIKTLGMDDLPGRSTTVSYRDPITGESITHNVGGDLSAMGRIGARETDAQAKAYEWISDRVQAQQNMYNDLVRTTEFIDENQLQSLREGGIQWARPVFGGWQYNIGDQNNPLWVTEGAAINHYQQRNLQTYSQTALNEFFGGNDQTLAFFQSGSANAQAVVHNLYDAFSQIASSTYGNLYEAAFDTVGQSLLSAELTGGAVEKAKGTLEAQSFKAFEQQKALRKSIGEATELFHKTKSRLRKRRKTPKARFGGFRKDVPQ